MNPSTGPAKTVHYGSNPSTTPTACGAKAKMVVVYGDAEVGQFFEPDYGQPEKIEQMIYWLRKAGYYAEPCNSWSAAIYPIDKRKRAPATSQEEPVLYRFGDVVLFEGHDKRIHAINVVTRKTYPMSYFMLEQAIDDIHKIYKALRD